MPPKRKRDVADCGNEAAASTVAKKPKTVPKKLKSVVTVPKKTAKNFKMPPPVADGEIFTDFSNYQWKIGGSVGKGGFGEIYLASPSGKNPEAKKTQYVIKVEPHENGPLFAELSFYRRLAKPESLQLWTKSRKLNYLPIPRYIGSGSHKKGEVMYRFMVMERFGDDVEKLFCAANRKFGLKTVCYLALRIIEALEYLHDNEYVHADIKGSNLLIGHLASDKHKVYLVDYGLAYRYICEGKHKEYKADPKCSHDGTIEFTSIDAHDGARPSRRGDMEILGYCLIQWASGDLPWMGQLNNKPKVATEKKKYKSNVSGLLKACFKDEKPPKCLVDYMNAVYKYEYNETPDYASLKALFTKELKNNGWKDDKDGLDWLPGEKKSKQPIPKQSTRPLPKKKQLKYDDDVDDDDEPRGASPKKKRLNNNDDDNEPGASPIGSRRSTRIAQLLSPQKKILTEPNEEDEPEKQPKKKINKQAEIEKSPPLSNKVPQKKILTEPNEEDEPEKQPKKKTNKQAEIEKSPPLSNKVPVSSPIKKKTTKKDIAPSLLLKQVEEHSSILNKPASSPRKKKLNNGVTNSNTLLSSPSKRLPTVRYPSELGYNEPETFGSLAKKKRKIDKP